MSQIFVPSRAAGLARLDAFLPHAGRDYAHARNHAPAPDGPPTTAMLSPWLRHRLLTEAEVVAAARAGHGEAAEKFVQEVVWRSYFKGWLEGRPQVWEAYRRGVAAGRDRLAAEGGLRRLHAKATAGETGIDGFDAWARALVAGNWLHNHERMWFASIWIFTLRLPWELGADFFLRHLLDGDPASNTLSWRWVAGLHTVGKPYVARADNIARYTDGRFDPRGELDEDPEALREEAPLPPHRLPEPDAAPAGEVALLLHPGDLAPETLDLGAARVTALAGIGAAYEDAAAPVAAFAEGALRDGLARAEARFGVPARMLAPAEIGSWADGRPVVALHAPVGPEAQALAGLPVPVRRLRRDWDAACWPHAGRGYFQLRSRIPDVLAAAGVG